MKTRRLTRLLSSAAFAAMTFASSAVFAQVKIGTNPTTIGANSNLEVEAANNKKVIVHKNDGTVVIENMPSGAVTDSIMSVDAAGNVRRISTARITRPPVYVFEMSGNWQGAPQAVNFALGFEVDGFITPSSATSDRSGPNAWKAPAAGIYRIDLRATGLANNNVSGYGIITVEILRNWGTPTAAVLAGADATVSTYGPNANRGTASLFTSKTLSLAAGDVISAQMRTCNGCGPDYYWGAGTFTIQRLE